MVNSQDSYAQLVAVATTHGVVDVYQAYDGAASGQTLPFQVLFKNLNVDLKEVSPSSILMDKVPFQHFADKIGGCLLRMNSTSMRSFYPHQIHPNTLSMSGVVSVVIGGVSRYLDMHTKDNKYWLYLINHVSKPKFTVLFHLQVYHNFIITKAKQIVIFLHIYSGHKNWVLFVAWSPDGKHLDLDAFSAAIVVSIAFSFIPASLVVAIMKVLFKNLNVDLKEVSPSSLLMDKVREVEGNHDFSNKMSGHLNNHQ
ncbi:unnamed protein product [Lactuca saligna]|uniref:Uncharacterized protein n=1 Tax=Lactuca saligna TaxID=75948 RepID=A0AA36E6Z3_LACSI|nr:unnamed protein product [Lactuca saligna]